MVLVERRHLTGQIHWEWQCRQVLNAQHIDLNQPVKLSYGEVGPITYFERAAADQADGS